MDATKPLSPLANYATTGSEGAFRELVRSYSDFVYAIALRKIGGDTHLAEDITQQVFTDLAQKAALLPRDVMVGGWLHRHTCFVASKVLRSELRRRAREQEASAMNINDSHAAWKQVAPVLDDAIDALESNDREAILLRFFEKCDFRSIGNAMGVSDDAAQKRVSRALEKLRILLAGHGVVVTTVVLGTILAEQVVAAARLEFNAGVAEVALEQVKGSKSQPGPSSKLASSSKLAVVGVAVVALVSVLTVVRIFTANKPVIAETGTSAARVHAGVSSEAAAANAPIDGQPAQNKPTNGSGADAAGTGSSLQLVVVAADSGKPIPNVPIDLRVGANDFRKNRKVSTDRLGVCNLSVPSGIDLLQLTTRKEGFADTRLEWWPGRGDVIPAQYTLRLQRPIRIAGRVVAENNQPIEGASVYFGCNADLSLRKGPEYHDFTWVTTKTDETGRWEMNRIAEDAWPRAFGYAEHTNFVSEHLGQTLPAEAAQQMRAGTHIFRLKETITVTGQVADSEALPVGGAKVLVNGDDDHPSITAADGTFSVARCKPGRTRITVEAEGFAGVTIDTQCSLTSAPVRILLQRGKPLLLRIVDKAGKPVTNATVQLRMMVRTHDATVYRRMMPDAEGQVVWKSAPDQEMLFSVYANNYGEEAFTLRPDGTERVITMSPATVVRGTVRDDSGELIPAFRVAIGYPQATGHKTNIQWGLNPEQWLSFKAGRYEHVFEHWSPVDLSVVTNNPGYILKFESEDHAPFISRLIQPAEGVVQLDVILRRAPSATIRVATPAGTLGAKAEIALMTSGMSKQGIAAGKFGSVVQGGRLVANVQGEFQLPADENIEKVVVIHPEGFSEVGAAELRLRGKVELQAWGNIEGTFFSRGQPLAGVNIYALRQSDHVRLDLHPVTDAKGWFSFSKVPPGDYILQWRMPRVADSAESNHGFSKRVSLQPSETATADIGGPGYAVTVRFRWPDHLQQNTNMHIQRAITAPLPEGLPQRLAPAFTAKPESSIYFGLGFATESKLVISPEALGALKGANHYGFQALPDGSFLAEGVEPGSGLATFIVIDRAESERKQKLVIAAAAAVSINIPLDPPTGTIDLGEIQLTLPPAE